MIQIHKNIISATPGLRHSTDTPYTPTVVDERAQAFGYEVSEPCETAVRDGLAQARSLVCETVKVLPYSPFGKSMGKARGAPALWQVRPYEAKLYSLLVVR
jgi:hypothetical protein